MEQASKRFHYFLWKINYYTPEKCPLLGYYAARSANSLPTFQDNLSVPSSPVKSSHHYTPPNRSVPIYFAAEILRSNARASFLDAPQ